MPQLIDIQELEAAMEEFRISERSKAELPGGQGVVARGQIAVLPEITIWRAREVNRESDPNHVMNAIVALIAATIIGETTSLNLDIDQTTDVVNRVLAGVAGEIAAILANQRTMTNRRFDFKEAGNA